MRAPEARTLRAGLRARLSWAAWLGFAAALWLLGWPTRPGPHQYAAGYFAGLAGLAGAAALLWRSVARADADGLRAQLRRAAPVLLALAGTAAGLLAAEAFVRATRRAEWGGGLGPLQPSWKLRGYQLNSSRFRGPDLFPSDLAKKRVVLGVGDSFTFAQGVAWEDSWLQRLERALNGGAAGPWLTVNAAKPGWNTFDEARWLSEKGFAMAPRVLILQYTLNDPELRPYMLAPLTGWSREEPWLWRSHLFFLLVKARNLRTRPYERHIEALFDDASPGWRASRNALAFVAGESRRRGIQPVLAIFPLLHDLDRYPFTPLHAKVAAAGRDAGFEVVDLLGAFRAAGPTAALRVSPGDWHPNAAGHKIAADALAALLQRPQASR